MLLCKYCAKECKNQNSFINHERTCPKNIDRKYKNYSTGLPAWNKGLTIETDSRVKNNAESIKKSGDTIGRCKDPIKEEERRKKLSIAAKKNGFGGYQANAGRSKKFKVIDSFGKITTLQSSYEYTCYQILTILGIRWVRPKALKYDNRNYFADFYLPDQNIWLDPKNKYKAKLDAVKISKVIEQNNVKLFVLLEEQLTKEFIARLTETD